jgi:hypothetical protein
MAVEQLILSLFLLAGFGFGVVVGANVLFGRSGRSVALQPLSVQAQIGLDLTLGVSGLELRPLWRGSIISELAPYATEVGRLVQH